MKNKKLSSLLIFLGGVCMAVMIASCILMAALFWHSSGTAERERYAATLESILNTADDAISATVQQLTDIGYSGDMISYMKSPPEQAFEKQEYVRTTFNGVRLLNDSLLDIYLCFGDGHVLYTTPTNQMHTIFYYEAFLQARNYFRSHQAQVNYSPCYELGSTGKYTFGLYIPIYDYTIRDSHGFYAGSIIALYDASSLCDVIDGFPIAIQDDGGQIICRSEGVTDADLTIGEAGLQFDPDRFQTLEVSWPETGWRLIGGYTHNHITSEFATLLRWMVVGIIIMVLILTLLCLLIYRSILDPVRSVAQQLNEIENSDTRILSVYEKRNELTVLTDGINGMLSRLANLSNQLVMHEHALAQMKLSKMSEKLLLLQSQINPHFLYNNLECIRGMVAMGEMDEILEMTTRMASIYRYCVKDQSVATIAEELENLNDYFTIMTMRYFGTYQLNVAVPEQLLSQSVPRMLLQPLVENAVLHGMKAGKHPKGSIRIEAHRTDKGLDLCVLDDGAGIPEETMNSLNAEFASADNSSAIAGTGKIGLHNINLRLKVLFGSSSCIELKPNSPTGVLAIAHIDEREGE